MSLPTKTTLLSLSYSFSRGVWVRVASKTGQSPSGMSWSKIGIPFWFIEEGTTPPAATNVVLNVITNA